MALIPITWDRGSRPPDVSWWRWWFGTPPPLHKGPPYEAVFVDTFTNGPDGRASPEVLASFESSFRSTLAWFDDAYASPAARVNGTVLGYNDPGVISSMAQPFNRRGAHIELKIHDAGSGALIGSATMERSRQAGMFPIGAVMNETVQKYVREMAEDFVVSLTNEKFVHSFRTVNTPDEIAALSRPKATLLVVGTGNVNPGFMAPDFERAKIVFMAYLLRELRDLKGRITICHTSVGSPLQKALKKQKAKVSQGCLLFQNGQLVGHEQLGFFSGSSESDYANCARRLLGKMIV